MTKHALMARAYMRHCARSLPVLVVVTDEELALMEQELGLAGPMLERPRVATFATYRQLAADMPRKKAVLVSLPKLIAPADARTLLRAGIIVEFYS